MPEPRAIAVVVTGSVAAVKTFILCDALRARGMEPRLVLTPSALQFFKSEGKYAATVEQLASLPPPCHPERSEGSPPTLHEILRCAQDDIAGVLIAPASADFIRQVVLKDTGMGRAVAASGKPLMIAPAMNVMMWAHPAVQKNVRAARDAGVAFCGPASGGMACGDTGYGRMAEPGEIAEAMRALLDGKDVAGAWGLIDTPALPRATRKPCERVLLVHAVPDDGLTEKLLRRGYDVQCVAETPDAELARMTGHAVVTAHYQLYPRDGMEHIWLPEDSDVVVMRLSPERAAEMAKGAAESFVACVYLASKRPVIVIPAPGCAKEDITALAGHGAVITDEDGLEAAIAGLEEEEDAGFAGLSILVLGGSARETVDSFRFYANAARPEGHGADLARELAARGASVKLVEARGSARDLVARAVGDFDIAVQMANISQFACPAPAAHKISKRGPERARLFEVEGNTDVLGALDESLSAHVVGYDNFQQWTDAAPTELTRKIASLARRGAA